MYTLTIHNLHNKIFKPIKFVVGRFYMFDVAKIIYSLQSAYKDLLVEGNSDITEFDIVYVLRDTKELVIGISIDENPTNLDSNVSFAT